MRGKWFVGARLALAQKRGQPQGLPLLGILLLLTINLHAEAFERLGLGTRAMGMGGAYVAVCDDVTSVFWNPAGLVNIPKDEITFSHNNYLGLDALNNNFLGYARTYVGPGTLGLAWIHLGTKSGAVPEDFNEETFYLSYGFYLFNGLSTGITVKYFLANYNHVRGAGYTVDYGILYNLWNWIYLGLNYYNVNNPQIQWYTETKEYLKSNLNVGFYYKMFEQLYLTYEAANILRDKNNLEHHLGCNGIIVKKRFNVYLGAIYYSNKRLSYTGGLEFQHKSFMIGYTLNYHYDLELSHMWSIKLQL